jgi:hypothetical protein
MPTSAASAAKHMVLLHARTACIVGIGTLTIYKLHEKGCLYCDETRSVSVDIVFAQNCRYRNLHAALMGRLVISRAACRAILFRLPIVEIRNQDPSSE